MGRKRAIICFETEERFESVTDAANAIGATWSLVSSALKRHGACRGFHFYYADEVKPDDSVFDRKVYKNSRPIICLETNERFESQARAAKAVGVPREAIYAALRGHIATKGLHFYYADEPKPDEEIRRKRGWTRVRCKETGVVYKKIAQAEQETGDTKNKNQAADLRVRRFRLSIYRFLRTCRLGMPPAAPSFPPCRKRRGRKGALGYGLVRSAGTV